MSNTMRFCLKKKTKTKLIVTKRNPLIFDMDKPMYSLTLESKKGDLITRQQNMTTKGLAQQVREIFKNI